MANVTQVDQSTQATPNQPVAGPLVTKPLQVTGDELSLLHEIVLEMRRNNRLMEILVDEHVGLEDIEDGGL